MMMKSEQIRIENLQLLALEAGGVVALSKVIGKASSQVSQWMGANRMEGKTSKPKFMSHQSCREIESLCEKPEGWMDVPHAPQDAQFEELLALYRTLDPIGQSLLMGQVRMMAQAFKQKS